MAQPTEASFLCLLDVVRYLNGTPDLAIKAPLHGDEPRWEHYVDAGHAGNPKIDAKCRPHQGIISLNRGAPILWKSFLGGTAVAFPELAPDGHSVRSSGEAETFVASNAIDENLHLSYVVEETGQPPIPRPFQLQSDATVAIAFSRAETGKSRMKHIDCRQGWVRQLRDKDLVKLVKVDTKVNLADTFTKLLRGQIFLNLRRRFMDMLPAWMRPTRQ